MQQKIETKIDEKPKIDNPKLAKDVVEPPKKKPLRGKSTIKKPEKAELEIHDHKPELEPKQDPEPEPKPDPEHVPKPDPEHEPKLDPEHEQKPDPEYQPEAVIEAPVAQSEPEAPQEDVQTGNESALTGFGVPEVIDLMVTEHKLKPESYPAVQPDLRIANHAARLEDDHDQQDQHRQEQEEKKPAQVDKAERRRRAHETERPETDFEWKFDDDVLPLPGSRWSGRGDGSGRDSARAKTMEELISSITITAREVLGPVKNRRTVRDLIKEAKLRYDV